MFSFFLLLKECIFDSSFGTNHFGNKQNQLTGFSALVQEPGYLHQTHVTVSLGFSQCSSCPKTGYLGQHKGTSDILIIVFHWGFHGKEKTKQNKTTTAFHLQKFKLGKRAEWSAGWLCLPNPSEDYGICETSALIAFLHPPSADKKCVFTGCFRSRRMWRLMKVVTGVMKHCSSVEIFSRVSLETLF